MLLALTSGLYRVQLYWNLCLDSSEIQLLHSHFEVFYLINFNPITLFCLEII